MIKKKITTNDYSIIASLIVTYTCLMLLFLFGHESNCKQFIQAWCRPAKWGQQGNGLKQVSVIRAETIF